MTSDNLPGHRPAATMEDAAILVVSCDAYSDLWRPFFQLFFKYWPSCPFPVYLGSNEATHPDPRVRPVLVGPDRDYASNLRAMLEQVGAPWIVLWVEDLMLSAPVDGDRLTRLIARAQRLGAASLKLMTHFPYAYSDDPGEEMGLIPEGSRYRVSIGITLFRRDVLLALLRPGSSAWDLEYRGAGDVKGDFCAFTPRMRAHPPIAFVNTVGRGKWIRNAIPFLEKEGLHDCIPVRQRQPLSSYLYYRAYLARLEVYRMLKLRW